MMRGGHEVVLQGVDDDDTTRLVERITGFFDQSAPSGSISTGEGTVIRNSEIVGVRSTSEQELTEQGEVKAVEAAGARLRHRRGRWLAAASGDLDPEETHLRLSAPDHAKSEGRGSHRLREQWDLPPASVRTGGLLQSVGRPAAVSAA